MEHQFNLEEFLKKRGKTELDKRGPKFNLESIREIEVKNEKFDEIPWRGEQRKDVLEHLRPINNEIQPLKPFERTINLKGEVANALLVEAHREALSRERFSIELRQSQKKGLNANFSPTNLSFGGGFSDEEIVQVIIRGEGARFLSEQPKKAEETKFLPEQKKERSRFLPEQLKGDSTFSPKQSEEKEEGGFWKWVFS